jgi:predicted nucleic acid binding AN1-type Zn finger protein
MRVSIQTLAHGVVTLELDAADTIAAVKQKLMAALGASLNESQAHYFLSTSQGQPMTEETRTLADYGIKEGGELTFGPAAVTLSSSSNNNSSSSTAAMTTASTSSTTEAPASPGARSAGGKSSAAFPAKRRAGRCHFGDCTDRVVKIVGDCRYCTKRFCGRHRLPEVHACANLTSCQQASFERNAGKLLQEKCVASKV